MFYFRCPNCRRIYGSAVKLEQVHDPKCDSCGCTIKDWEPDGSEIGIIIGFKFGEIEDEV